jgi:hypothetical protein
LHFRAEQKTNDICQREVASADSADLGDETPVENTSMIVLSQRFREPAYYTGSQSAGTLRTWA